MKASNAIKEEKTMLSFVVLKKCLICGIFLLILCTSCVAVYGQSDSLITLQGEVLVGQVSGHRNFKVDGKKYRLDPEKYKAYKNGQTWYRSVHVSSTVEPVWMEWLEQGTIELYQYVTYGASRRVSPRDLPTSTIVWLARKNGGPLLNVNGVMASEQQAKSNMERLLLGQKDLLGELKIEPFSARLIRGLIAAYNHRSVEEKQ